MTPGIQVHHHTHVIELAYQIYGLYNDKHWEQNLLPRPSIFF